jgi:hypothetical protein
LALVIGPNGAEVYIPDEDAPCLVGNGERGHSYAPEPKPEPVKRTPRRTTSK